MKHCSDNCGMKRQYQMEKGFNELWNGTDRK